MDDPTGSEVGGVDSDELGSLVATDDPGSAACVVTTICGGGPGRLPM